VAESAPAAVRARRREVGKEIVAGAGEAAAATAASTAGIRRQADVLQWRFVAAVLARFVAVASEVSEIGHAMAGARPAVARMVALVEAVVEAEAVALRAVAALAKAQLESEPRGAEERCPACGGALGPMQMGAAACRAQPAHRFRRCCISLAVIHSPRGVLHSRLWPDCIALDTEAAAVDRLLRPANAAVALLCCPVTGLPLAF
jgi:hypothetical protein